MSGEIPDERRAHIADDPFCELIGIELADIGPGTARTELTITEQHLNFHGIPHGGAINALADAAFAAASNAAGRTAFALETNISFLEAVEVGTTLTAIAEERHVRGKTGSYEISVTDDDEEPVATFRGRVYRPE
jgi:acyl-CoA thioesterase